MIAKVLGIQKVDYLNKNNRQVTGTSFHICYPKKHVDGEACESVFISEKADISGVGDIKVGDMVNLFYNRYGSVEDVAVKK